MSHPLLTNTNLLVPCSTETMNTIHTNRIETETMEAAQHLLQRPASWTFKRPIPALAASSATEKEIAAAKLRKPDGTGPVEVDKRPYRPKMPNEYIEPEFVPDQDTLDVISQTHGTVLLKTKAALPPRTDVINFDPQLHESEFSNNIQWASCPQDLRAPFETIIKDFWDVFVQEGLRRNIRGYSFNVDTGPSKPICCKVPRYGPHESRVITNLANDLEKNGLIEDDFGPWGAIVILAGKPYQEHKHWSDYIFRLCVSYRPLNRITRPFTFPSRRCDDAATDIGPANFFITMDLDSGYWQVSVVPESRDKLAFFVPDGKKHWTVMPLGATNAHPCFCAMMAQFRREWDHLAASRGIKGTQTKLQPELSVTDTQNLTQRSGSEAIVDDVLIYSTSSSDLLAYFKCVLEILRFYRATVKLKKCRFCPSHAEFVGLDLTAAGNQPAESKMKLFRELELDPPHTMTDLRHLIGLLGFYQQWIPLFEVRIKRWRDYQAMCPPGTASPQEEAQFLQNIWSHDDEELRRQLLTEISEKPSLARPDYDRRFYLKTDWSKHAMAAVLLQADPTDEEALNHETKEKQGGPCVFDSKKTSLRLLPLAYISRRTTAAEQSYHSYIGEASTGVWAIRKFQRYLLGPEFTWMTDCSGLMKFLDTPDLPTHATQRWRQFLLRFSFTVVHRPDKMMKEVDTLSRYNQATALWRTMSSSSPANDSSPPIAFSWVPINTLGSNREPPSRHLEATIQKRSIIVFGAATSSAVAALAESKFTPHIVAELEDRDHWNIPRQPTNFAPQADKFPSSTQFLQHLRQKPRSEIPTVDWIVASDPTALDCDDGSLHHDNLLTLIEFAAAKMDLHTVLWTSCREAHGSSPATESLTSWMQVKLGWHTRTLRLRSLNHGSAIDSEFRLLVASSISKAIRDLRIPTELASPMFDHLDFVPEIDQAMHTLKAMRMSGPSIPLDEPRPFASLEANRDGTLVTVPIFDPMHPAPALSNNSFRFHQAAFAVATPDDTYGQLYRGITLQETFNLLGLPIHVQDRLRSSDRSGVADELAITVPATALACILDGLFDAESMNPVWHNAQSSDDADIATAPERHLRVWLADVSKNIPVLVLHQPASLPLPTREQWLEESLKDHDMSQIIRALHDNTDITRDHMHDKRYHDEWKKQRFHLQNGILCRSDLPRLAQAQHIYTRVVPPSLRQMVFAAFHASPLAGHMGLAKTYHRIATRYWWPTMATDIRRMTLGCAHCRAVNASNHEAQQILKSLQTEQPFDIIFLDVWSPGKVPPIKSPSGSSTGPSAVLTSLCGMTAFAAGAPLVSTTSEEAAKTAFQHFFVTRGLPRLIIIDRGSEFAGYLISMCKLLAIEYYPVTRENHKAILNERFHRYLNKVQRLHSLDCRSYSDWIMGLGFAIYAWNSAPIDGTDSIRSFVALGRHFPFPLDLQSDERPQQPPDPAFTESQVHNHLAATFPLLAKQRDLLSILVEDRRQRHADIKNARRDPARNKFHIGDLVLVRKQVQSSVDKGPAKLMTRTRGPYRVLEEIHQGTYRIQKLPLYQGQGRRSKPYSESAARMELLPSTLLLHPQTQGTDHRLAYLHFGQVADPLNNIFGADDFGSFQQADARRPYAYDRVADLWPGIEWNVEESDDDSAEEDNHDPPPTTDQNASPTDSNSAAPKRVHFDVSRNQVHDPPTTAPPSVIPAPPATSQTESLRRSSRRPRPSSKYHPASFQRDAPGPHTRQQRAHKLKSDLTGSKDKMCILRWPQTNSRRYDWRIAHIHSAEDEARGIYTIHLYIAHQTDSARKATRHCRFWPEIRRIDLNGNPTSLISVSPNKVNTFLQRHTNTQLMTHTLDLVENLILGPFEFQPGLDSVVPPKIWRLLTNMAPSFDCDVDNLDSIIPTLVHFSDWVQCPPIPIHHPTDDLWSRRNTADILYFTAKKVAPPSTTT